VVFLALLVLAVLRETFVATRVRVREAGFRLDLALVFLLFEVAIMFLL